MYREPIWTSLEELKHFNIIEKWREKWSLQTPFNYEIIFDPTLPEKGFQFERDIWVKLNRIHTGHGRCFDCLFKWNLISSPICDCGFGNQTMAQ